MGNINEIWNKNEDKLNKVRLTIAAIALAVTIPLGIYAMDRITGIKKCEQLLKQSGAITYTTSNYKQGKAISQFCYDNPIREQFLELVDSGLNPESAYHKVGEEYQGE